MSQLMALAEIARNPGIRIADFAELRNIKPASASNLIDKLEQRGWVHRERRGANQRIVHLFATPKGRSALQRHPAPSHEFVATALERISQQALAELDHNLGELITNLERILADSARVHAVDW